MRAGLGLDFGGVICERADAGEEYSNGMPLEAINPVPDALGVIAEMNELLHGRVWIVSKATRRTERMTREWLKRHRFFEMTGVSSERIFFVRERFRKRDICRELGITHFVDDRPRTLEMLQGFVKHLYLIGSDSRGCGITVTRDWLVLGRLLRQSILEGEEEER